MRLGVFLCSEWVCVYWMFLSLSRSVWLVLGLTESSSPAPARTVVWNLRDFFFQQPRKQPITALWPRGWPQPANQKSFCLSPDRMCLCPSSESYIAHSSSLRQGCACVCVCGTGWRLGVPTVCFVRVSGANEAAKSDKNVRLIWKLTHP